MAIAFVIGFFLGAGALTAIACLIPERETPEEAFQRGLRLGRCLHEIDAVFYKTLHEIAEAKGRQARKEDGNGAV